MTEQYIPLVLTRPQLLYVQKWIGLAVMNSMDRPEANVGVEVNSELSLALMRSDIEEQSKATK